MKNISFFFYGFDIRISKPLKKITPEKA